MVKERNWGDTNNFGQHFVEWTVSTWRPVNGTKDWKLLQDKEQNYKKKKEKIIWLAGVT